MRIRQILAGDSLQEQKKEDEKVEFLFEGEFNLAALDDHEQLRGHAEPEMKHEAQQLTPCTCRVPHFGVFVVFLRFAAS